MTDANAELTRLRADMEGMIKNAITYREKIRLLTAENAALRAELAQFKVTDKP